MRTGPFMWGSKVVAIVLGFAAALVALPVQAQNLIPHIREAVKFATSQGWCETRGPDKADCKEYTTYCRNDKWSEYVSDTFEMNGPLAVVQKGETPPPDGVINYIRDNPANQNQLPVLRGSSCYCECNEGDTLPGCGGKPAGTPVLVNTGGDPPTREECDAACAPRKTAPKCAGALPYIVKAAGTGAPTVAQTGAAAQISINATCFKPEECSAQDGTLETYSACPEGKGRCYAKEPVIQLNTRLGNVTQVQGMAQYVIAAYRYLISVVAIVSTVMFIFGAFLYLVGSALPKIEQGKKYMVDAAVGMLLVLGAVAILRTVNPNTLTLQPLRVYMVNTIQFIQAQYCKDIQATGKFALAGEDKLQVPPYDKVASNPKNFNLVADKTECGKFYYLENSPLGDVCEGNVCPKGSSCRNCADTASVECRGQSSAKFVCQKSIFSGSVSYTDFRRPTEIYLVFFCNYAQSNDAGVVADNIKLLKKETIAHVGIQAGGASTDEKRVGAAGYSFDLSEADIKDAESFCSKGGGLRGAILGMQYFDRIVSLGGTNLVDDYAVITKDECRRGANPAFAGYSDGQAGKSDYSETSETIVCANLQAQLLDGKNKFWKADELRAAVNGDQPITCDFNTSNTNAPSNPEAAGFCKKK